MKIETKDLSIELEPELLTEEKVSLMERLVEVATRYEQAKRDIELEALAKAGQMKSAAEKAWEKA